LKRATFAAARACAVRGSGVLSAVAIAATPQSGPGEAVR
jgi:hypothetical protein